MDETRSPETPTPTDETWAELLAQGRVSAAFARYRDSEALEPDTFQALKILNEVQDALRARDFGRAKARLESLEAHPPLLDWSDLAQQLRALEAASKRLEPQNPEPALADLRSLGHPVLLAEVETQRGTGLIFLNEVEAARSAFMRALESDPQHYRAVTNLGNLALENGEVDAAIVHYERALAMNADFANAHHNLGVAYRKKGQVGKSVRSLRKAQGLQQKELREEARATLKRGAGRSFAKYGRWLLYAVVIVALYLILRARGIL